MHGYFGQEIDNQKKGTSGTLYPTITDPTRLQVEGGDDPVPDEPLQTSETEYQ